MKVQWFNILFYSTVQNVPQLMLAFLSNSIFQTRNPLFMCYVRLYVKMKDVTSFTFCSHFLSLSLYLSHTHTRTHTVPSGTIIPTLRPSSTPVSA